MEWDLFTDHHHEQTQGFPKLGSWKARAGAPEVERSLFEHPDVVLTHWPIENHADQRAMAMLVYEAWRRMGKSFALYYCEVTNGEDTVQFSPTHYVDITRTEDRKRQACFAHTSQSPKRYYSVQEAVTRLRGLDCGYGHAEAYIHHIQSPSGWLPSDR